MRTFFSFSGSLFAILLLACVGMSEAAFAAEEVSFALVKKVEGGGLPKLRRSRGTEALLVENDKVNVGDKVITDNKSVVELVLPDGSIVRIGLNSEYKLDLVKDKGGFLGWVFSLAKGSIRALIEKSPDKKNIKFRVNTPTGTMGVRGTELVLSYRPETKITTLYVIEGEVEFGSLVCAKGKGCIPVRTGERASVGKEGVVSAAEAFPPGDILSLKAAGEVNAKLEEAVLGKEGANAGAGVGALTDADGKSLSQGRPKDEGMALFDELRKDGTYRPSSAAGDVSQMLKESSEKMASAQDALLGRDKQLREAMYAAMKNGTYGQNLKLAETFDDLTSGAKKSAEARASENKVGVLAVKKFALGQATVKWAKTLSAESIAKALSSGKVGEAKVDGKESGTAKSVSKVALAGKSVDDIKAMLESARTEVATTLALMNSVPKTARNGGKCTTDKECAAMGGTTIPVALSGTVKSTIGGEPVSSDPTGADGVDPPKADEEVKTEEPEDKEEVVSEGGKKIESPGYKVGVITTPAPPLACNLKGSLAEQALCDRVVSTSSRQYTEAATFAKQCTDTYRNRKFIFFVGPLMCGGTGTDSDQAVLADGQYYSNTQTYKQDQTIKETAVVNKTGGKCYETKKVCRKVLVPCDAEILKGKFCKAGTKEVCETSKKVEVGCPR